MFKQINKHMSSSTLLKVMVTGFCLNLVWEIVQSPLYTMAFGTSINLFSLLFAACGDALYIGFIFWLFSERLQKKYIWILLVAAGIITAVLVEKIALIFGAWQYGSNMPVIQVIHTGLTPTIQLALTSAATLLIFKIFKRNKKES